ncbi:Guanylate kinase Gmk [Helicobacter sp. NHP19-012]|uniref:Guanylate kinase n=1 Tax=Helicobacter gastrofelis TaxID=2849642 RepID=A0ABM7SNE7_9HELI|nr:MULTISPECIES: guanylate kinase [unclassified Helicobacter]BCZ19115.1 Guanylate kinase Gmk [Helicobacter sp. NHP19-012]GMB96665.1 Guanylate kinase Gmk [Helicobacter sp. NHP22-001]
MSNHAYRMLVLAGPSGSGKSTLISYLLQHCPNIYFSISTTTRPKRAGEVEGQHYYFVSQEAFIKSIENKQFLEWAKVHGHYYGTSLEPINKALKAGKLVLFDIDVQGHRSVKEVYKKATSIFITTKNIHTLKERLEQRHTDSHEMIERRLQTALQEIQEIELFDYVLINEDLELSKRMVLEVAHTLGYKQQMFPKETFCEAWGASHK